MLEMITQQFIGGEFQDGKMFAGFSAGVHSSHGKAITLCRPQEDMPVKAGAELLRCCFRVHGLGSDPQMGI